MKKAKPVSFDVSAKDAELIKKIVARFKCYLREEGCDNVDAVSCTMDVTACHANGTALDLEGLLAADRFNFLHDMVGIERHLNRDTGKLMDCFTPHMHRRRARP